jgi:hypothetical protein
MIFRLRPTLVLAAVVILVLCLRPSFGFFSHLAAAGAAVSLVLSLLALFLPDRNLVVARSGQSPGPADGTALYLIPATFVTTVLAVFSTQFFYDDHPENDRAIGVCAALGCLLAVAISIARLRALLCPRFDAPTRLTLLLLVLVVLAALALRALVLEASPDPVIDVYAWLRDSADHAVHGRNPYTHDIESPYGTERAHNYSVFEGPDPRPPAYPPLPFLLCVPFRGLGLDVRWANIVGDLLAGIALFGVGVRRGRPSLGLLSCCLFLNLPRSVWIIEQAWYEPMLAGLFGLGFWFIEFEGRRRWLGFLLLALALTGKQFGLPLLLPIAWSQRRHWRMLLVGLIMAGLVMLPWVAWSPRDFFDVILRRHLHRDPQFHSLTFASACHEFFHWKVPKELGWITAGALIFLVSWRTPRNGAATALGVGTALFVFCIFHTQGFPNYFYLCEYLWLVGMMGLLPENKAQGGKSSGFALTASL